MTIVPDEAVNWFQMAQPGHPLLEDHIAVTTLKLEQASTREEEGSPKTSSKNTFPAQFHAVSPEESGSRWMVALIMREAINFRLKKK